MGDLTFRNNDGTWGLKNHDITKVPRELYGVICKLKDYEAAGMTPKQVAELAEKSTTVDSIENDAYLHSAKCPKCGKYFTRGCEESDIYCSKCGQKIHIVAFSREEVEKALFEHEMDEYED